MGEDNACLSGVKRVTGIKSPALANLASLVIGWVTLRLLIVGASLWLIEARQTDRRGFTPETFAARLFESVRPIGAGEEVRSHFQPLRQYGKEESSTQSTWTARNYDLGLRASASDRAALPRQAHPIDLPLPNDDATPPASESLSPVTASQNWMFSGYLLVRPRSGPAGIASNGQLGGSQLGVRVQRPLFRSGTLTLSANGRLSSPIRQDIGKEAGLGIALKRSGRVPIELLIERRVGLDKGGRDAVAALFATGFDDFRLPARLYLSGYAQAGVVGLKSRDGFIDGTVRAERGLTTVGQVDIRLGAVLAGAKQPGVSRLDLGPAVAGRFRIAHASVRLAAEWRQRIGGDAAPGSGPAVTLGFDY